MYTDILINATSYENRIALVENGTLREFHLERLSERGLIGNIYLGRVVRVLPGIDAAFVDIGLERTGFLYVDDVIDPNKATPNLSASGASSPEMNQAAAAAPPEKNISISDLLRENQQVLVQIAKEPIGTKGARLTCNITLPCRNLVFMPLTDHIGISRKIEDELVRQQLRDKIRQLRPSGAGFIIRTVAENISSDELEADMEFLLLLWDEILSKSKKATVPNLIYKDLDIILRAVRDFFTESINELVVDNRDVYNQLLAYAKTFAPQLQRKINFYDSDTPLFESCGIEVDINSALDKKVWLRSGGYIIIEPTEALTVIDVNTGRYVGKNDLAETIFKTNMEAVKEIAYQLRLRNIGGIIIIDFIDMEDEQDREDLYTTFKKAMEDDKSRVNILKLSEFGLVQMTRKRLSESLTQTMCTPCHYCGGDGFVKSSRTVCYEIFRKVSRDARKIGGSGATLKVHPDVAEMLLNEEAHQVEELEQSTGKRFTIISVPDMHIKRYNIIWNQ
ncbi:Rne/Rng family ribonuclease [Desulfogranum mediterraneum]|uniref:Rne/Rng family ribonuclease n=1 Tax=Desulfogranum mediterraneum TaxID=160661 RepID=UPI00041816BF|nr:Rne/Rng family ribonuclease [Desulfogranum mediterraneum]